MKSWNAPSLPRLPGHGGPLRVHDTASATVRTVHPEGGEARLYVCGITPYDATHLGHAATYVTFDLVNRVWQDAGLSVTYVQNVTDVDEPLLERAERDGVDWQDLAAREIQLFRDDMEALQVLPPQHYVGAVEGIPDDVSAVTQLLADGTAYRVPVPEGEGEGHDVYLDLSTQPTFGAVSGWTREQMLEVFADRGGDPDREGKRDPLDPLLWRAARAGEPSWPGDSLGDGRPGWHIECSTIALRYLGMSFDIQGGGTDLIFPHHEMSAVQATAVTGRRPFASSYLHQAMVALDGEKMSKSKGNLVLVSRLRGDGEDPMAIRLLLLAQHYRAEWEYVPALLDAARGRLALWRRAVDVGSADDAAVSELVAGVRAALADDLDAPRGLALVDGWAEGVVGASGGPGEAAGAGQVALAGGGRADHPVAQAVNALLGVAL